MKKFIIAISLGIMAVSALAQTDPGMPDSAIFGHYDGSPILWPGYLVTIPVGLKNDENKETVFFYAGLPRGLGRLSNAIYAWPLNSWDILTDTFGIELQDYPGYLFMNVMDYCQTDPGCPNPLNTNYSWETIMTVHAELDRDSVEIGDTICIVAVWSGISSVRASCIIIEPEQSIGHDVAPISQSTMALYPNPFNGRIALDYYLPEASKVSIEIFDIAGKLVESLEIGVQAAGDHTISWNAVDRCSGIYFCRLRTNNGSVAKKILLLK